MLQCWPSRHNIILGLNCRIQKDSDQPSLNQLQLFVARSKLTGKLPENYIYRAKSQREKFSEIKMYRKYNVSSTITINT